MPYFVQPTPQASMIAGGPACGKSTALAQKVAQLLADGCCAQDILVLCATQECAKAFRRLLARECPPGTDAPVVCTPRVFALNVVAQNSGGADVRVLEPYEERFLDEDVQTCGLPRKARTTLASYLRQCHSHLKDEGDWLAMREEALVHDAMSQSLAFMEAMLPEQVVGHAVRLLTPHAETSPAGARPHTPAQAVRHVVADDYQLFSRASQVMANLLARESIVVAADPLFAQAGAEEAHPYPAGVQEFLDANPHARLVQLDTCHRPLAVCQALQQLREAHELAQLPWPHTHKAPALQAAHSQDDCAISVRAFPRVAEELVGIVSMVADALESGVPESRICVVGAHGAWRTHMARKLNEAGIAARQPKRPLRLQGDLREVHACRKAKEATLAKLAAHPRDATAWRCLVGFGDYLGRSTALADVRKAAQSSGMGLLQALEALDAGTLEGLDPKLAAAHADLAQAYRAGCQELADDAGGHCQETQPAGVGPDSHAAPGDQPPIPPNTPDSNDGGDGQKVLVCAPDQLAGREFDLIVFGGFVNGFVPTRAWFEPGGLVGKARKQARQRDLWHMHLVASRACGRLVFTWFEHCDLEFAERLGLRIGRIALQDGTRICQLQPSELLDVMGLGAHQG